MTVRRKLIAANLKQNGRTAMLADWIEHLAPVATSAEIVLCPPFPYLGLVASLQSQSIGLGAQDLSAQVDGAHTGEVGAEMLADIGCRYVIVGHSERRARFGDTDAVVLAKLERALAASLIPILCIGESLAQREAGDTEKVIRAQLQPVIDHLGVVAMQRMVLAYEPIWAIGTGISATPEQAQDVHRLIRAIIAAADATISGSVRILYGGSVNAGNAASLFAQPDVDGGLIGGASLKPADFAPVLLSV